MAEVEPMSFKRAQSSDRALPPYRTKKSVRPWSPSHTSAWLRSTCSVPVDDDWAHWPCCWT